MEFDVFLCHNSSDKEAVTVLPSAKGPLPLNDLPAGTRHATLRGLRAKLREVRTGEPTFADDLERIHAEQAPSAGERR